MFERLHAALLCTALIVFSVGYAVSGAHTEGAIQAPSKFPIRCSRRMVR